MVIKSKAIDSEMEEKLLPEEDNDFVSFPPCPDKPSESDCCGSGCSACVFDIYQKQLAAWKQQVENIKSRNRLENVDESKQIIILCQQRFLPFQVLSIQQHTHSTVLLTFQAVNEVFLQEPPEYIQIHHPLELKVGQYLVMKGNLQSSIDVSEGPVITRAYTPISGMKNNSLGRFKVLIKLYQDGKMSHYLKTLKQQDIVFWKGPYGNFEYAPNTYQYILMLCAGTGIAPMFNIARAVVKNEDDETYIHLLYACKSHSDILLRQKLKKLSSYWNFSVEIFLSCTEDQNLEDHILYHENIRKHRINREVVAKELTKKDPNRILALICGTKSFNKDMMSYVKDSGILDSNIFLF